VTPPDAAARTSVRLAAFTKAVSFWDVAQPHGQADHPGFQLLELADVHGDRFVPEVADQLNTRRATAAG
jgi:hypothetical protein